ncbi:MAG TPA: hypothetical protein PJ993_01050 [Candidatus Saccharibacteria bacterium]|nr:hypothetical protein [Candidatus Saccharibacteria bacterium]HMT39513.1 hypothetical protein [Candidatus Saccharibacteria bacterium]
MSLPKTYTKRNDTGCCAVPNISEWDEKEITFKDKKFIRMYTRSIFYMPLNMSKVMTDIQKQAEDAKAMMPAQEVMILSRDISPWKAEQLYAVSKTVKGADNVVLNGTFLTKVFEGPYQNAGKWYESLKQFAKSKNSTIEKIYMFYTTCPKCAKHYDKNYTIGMAQVK